MSRYILSIIIPVYNVEKYLDRCLSSVVQQEGVTQEDYEVIVVNDGSPDNSLAIAERFARENKNLKVISQANAGLSAARNVGIAESAGEYVWCVDSDDWIDNTAISVLLNEINKGQVDFISISAHRTDTGKTRNIQLKTDSPHELLCSSTWEPNAQFYIYRKDFLTRNGLCFMKGIYHEDSEFTPRMMYLASKCCVTNIPLYYSYCNPTSITQTPNAKKSYDDIIVACSLIDFLHNNVKEEEVKVLFYNFAAMIINNGLYHITKHTSEEIQKFNAYVYTHRNKINEALLSSPNIKYKIEGCIFKLFSKRYVQIYRYIRKIKK